MVSASRTVAAGLLVLLSAGLGSCHILAGYHDRTFGSELGQPCSDSSSCISGSCADGICCDAPCASSCDRCDLAGSIGICTAATDEQEPGCFSQNNWAKHFAVAHDQQVSALEVDSKGRVFVAGWYSGSLRIGNFPNRSAGSTDMFVACFQQNTIPLWRWSVGDQGDDRMLDLAIDSQDQIVLIGSFAGTVDFGGDKVSSNAGSEDILLAKLANNGVALWARAFGDASSQAAKWTSLLVETDHQDDDAIIMAGTFAGTMSFDDTTIKSSSGNDGFVVKLDRDGKHLFSHRFAIGSNDQAAGRISGLTVDPTGQVLLAGTFSGGVKLEDGQALYPDGALPFGVFMLAYDGKDGQRTWAKAIPAGGSVAVGGLATEPSSGDISLFGSFGYTLSFDGDQLVSIDSSDVDGFIARFDASAGLLSADAVGGAGYQSITSAAHAPGGELMLGGHFDGSLALPGGNVTVASGTGEHDIFVAKTSKAKPVEWLAGFGDSAEQSLTAVRTAANGDVLLAGDFAGMLPLDPNDPLVSGGAVDGYVARLGSDGAHLSGDNLGDLHVVSAEGLAVGPKGDIAMAGHFLGMVDFGNGVLTSHRYEDDVFARPFSEDGFVARWSSAGVLSHAVHATGLENIRAYAVALDSSDRCAAVFLFTGTLSIAEQSYTAPAGQAGVLVVLFDAQGALLFGQLVATRVPSPFGEAQLAVALGAEAVLVAGGFDASLSLPGLSEPSAGGDDAFVVALGIDGQLLWSHRLGDEQNQAFYGLVVDPRGDVLLAGRLAGTMMVGGTPYTSAGGDDALLMQLDGASGAPRWVATFGDAENQQLESISSSGKGETLVAGSFAGAFSMGPDTLSAVSTAGHDKLLAMVNGHGVVQWARALETDLPGPPRVAISTDGATLLLAGSFEERVTFGGVDIAARGQATFSSASFVARFTPDGNFSAATTVGHRGKTRTTGLALDGLGRAVLAARFDQTADLPLSADKSTQLSAVGVQDTFVARLTPP